MRIQFHKNFIKQSRKFNDVSEKIDERLRKFSIDPFHPILKNHALHGKYANHKSINISGDVRAIYRMIDKNTVIFVELGTHNDLYE